jgi:carboxyl-terminal processing protease
MMISTRMRLLSLSLALTTGLIALAGCGGGGGGGGGGTTSPPVVSPPPPPPTGITWTPNSFQPASVFKNRCETPRVGSDSEGTPFPDLAGSLLQEKFWLRSWTNETYLWNTEVTDRDPASIAGRLDYFAVLKTTAKTASGKDKDDFHFSQSTASFLAQRNSAPSATYGARIVALSSTRPRDYRVLYTEPNSPASQVTGSVTNLIRGSRILSIDGIDLINGGTTQAELDILNAGLFPTTAGKVTTFVVRDPGATGNRTVVITSTNLSSKPVNRTSVISTPTGNVGYILFNTFSPFASEREIVDAVTNMRDQNIADLVLDLRYNGGGLLTVASQLSYMVAGAARTNGRAFERLRFNDAAGNRNPVTGATNTPTAFRSTGAGFSVATGTTLPVLNLPRVFVLSTDRTCSASEAVINGLRGIGVEVILVGTTTCGKPFGFYPQDNCGETYYTIQFQGVNDVGFGDYADGFIANNSPATFGVRVAGCAVADDFSRELGDPQEALLAAALGFRANGSCPTSPTAQSMETNAALTTFEEQGVSVDGVLLDKPDSIMETNRDMTPPRDR